MVAGGRIVVVEEAAIEGHIEEVEVVPMRVVGAVAEDTRLTIMNPDTTAAVEADIIPAVIEWMILTRRPIDLKILLAIQTVIMVVEGHQTEKE